MTNPKREPDDHQKTTSEQSHIDRDDLSFEETGDAIDDLQVSETQQSDPSQPNQQNDDDFDFDTNAPEDFATLIAPEDHPLKSTLSGDSEREQIPGFRLLEELGRGAFGVVFKAEDETLGRQVAIKLPVLRNRSLAEKYVQEARNAALIDATGIVPVFQVGTTPSGNPFVVQKLIQGSTLQNLLKTSDSLPVAWVLDTIRKIAAAMGKAHEAGLIHRDLKPANILIDPSGDPWIADFGLSVLEEDQSSLKGEVAGTPTYMAPEQLSGRADWLDGRSDIWAIGIILYEMLTGKAPFSAESFKDLREQITQRDPRPICQRVPSLPSEIDQIFSRCCAKKTGERYPSAKDLAADLQNVLMTAALPMEEVQLAKMPDGATTIRTRTLVNTFRNQTGFGATTVVSPNPTQAATASQVWIGIAIASLLLVSIAVVAVLWWPAGKDSSGSNAAETITTPGLPSANSAGTADTQAENPPPIRWLVSPSASDAYRSIRAAVEAAPAGVRIEIEPGTYREDNLNLAKEIELFGTGGREDVRIVGNGQPAVRVSENSNCLLTNVSLAATGDGVNTIEVASGSLTMKGCSVQSTSFDCVKVYPNGRLLVIDCRLETSRHPAIVAEKDAVLELRDSDFRFSALNIGIDRADPISGVQLSECQAEIINCDFTGSPDLGKGISARDCVQAIRIVNCKFTSLKHGVELFSCSDVTIESQTEIAECELGVYAEGCRLSIQDTAITNCNYGGTLLDDCQMVAINLRVSHNRAAGLWVDKSKATLQGCQLVDNETVAVLVDGRAAEEPAVTANQSHFRDNQIGILLVCGRVNLSNGSISGNSRAGIAVVDYEQIPAALRRRAEDNSSGDADVRLILADQMAFNALPQAPAILFNAVGTYELKNCQFVDSENKDSPALSAKLTTKVQGSQSQVVLAE